MQRDPLGYIPDINLYKYPRNNPLNWADPYGLIGNFGPIWGPQGLGSNPAAVPGQQGIQIRISPPPRQVLRNLNSMSLVAAIGSTYFPGGQSAAVIFTGISLSSKALETYLYSNHPNINMTGEGIKMVVEVPPPYNLLTDPLIDIIMEGIKIDLDNSEKNQTKCPEE